MVSNRPSTGIRDHPVERGPRLLRAGDAFICILSEIRQPRRVAYSRSSEICISGLWLLRGRSAIDSMAIHFSGDLAATDATRFLWLPGFSNRKLAVEFVVQVVQATDQIYSINDFHIPQDSPAAPRNVSDGARSHPAPRHRRQSERDWSYAKRALARGDNPQEVMQRIADYRPEDKYDPLYYARLTVNKDQIDLKRETERPESISRKTGYKIFDRYQECGMQGLTDRSRRPYRYANQLPFQVETSS
jgi:hypothetical protein